MEKGVAAPSTTLERELIQVDKTESDHWFSVLQWNVLADCLAHGENSDPKYLDWNHRYPLILSELKHHQTDLLCLQEIDKFEDIKTELKDLNYDGVFAQKRGRDGSALFWKTSSFDLIKTKKVKLSGNYGVTTQHMGQIAILAHLKHKNQKDLVVVVTHLKSSPEYASVRLSQAVCLTDYLRDFISEIGPDSKIPFIITGDLNDSPSSDMYKYLTTGSVQNVEYGYKNYPRIKWILSLILVKWPYYAILSLLMLYFGYNVPAFTVIFALIVAVLLKFTYPRKSFTHYFNISSSYSLHPTLSNDPDHSKVFTNVCLPHQEGGDAPYTLHINWKLFNWKVTIDFILYSDNLLQVSKLLSIPAHERVSDCLPSKHHPSDHLNLVSYFSLKK
eukprot:TRINITY_DN6617_c0_g1_i1.p1 TRINITY_DN6617_c0_g1~~TRINITY_DN6617_c0_g1_i1.p1  ORF type:complete len:388 (-),score=29.98 TRINITY_DN6617_c0_g1_i1:16-1179(-)